MKQRQHLTLLGTIVCMVFVAASGHSEDKKDAPTKKEPPKDFVVQDELINADLKDTALTESFSKSYTFKMIQGKTYRIEMTSKAFNSYLRLENPDGLPIAVNNAGGGNRPSRIVFDAPKTGDYQIVATTGNGGATGKFTLSIGLLPDAFTRKDTLENKDPRYRNKIHKLILFPVEAGNTYQIDMKSTAFDAYLYLEDPDNVLLAQDDDSGGNLNSRITFKATKTGQHRLIATHYGASGNGPFSVTIRQIGMGN